MSADDPLSGSTERAGRTARARDMLGDEVFAARYTAGSVMTHEQLVASVLGVDQVLSDPGSGGDRPG